MKILYNDKDIYKDISLNYAVHEMYAGDFADNLTLRFNDPKGVWSKWDPEPGDTISLEHKKAKTGKLYIFQMEAQNGMFMVRAMSMPPSMSSRRSASWEKVKYTQIASEIAERHGLMLKTYGVKDQLYASMRQQNESDIAFLNHLSLIEGNQLIIYDGQLIIYDEAEMENTSAPEVFEVGQGTEYTYSDESGEAYGVSKVIAGTFTGSYESGGSTRQIETILRANSDVEAARFAKNILRSKNKALQKGSIKTDFTSKYAPASVLNISTKKAVRWNGKSFITKVRQDYVKNLTVLYFRNITLEGY